MAELGDAIGWGIQPKEDGQCGDPKFHMPVTTVDGDAVFMMKEERKLYLCRRCLFFYPTTGGQA